MGVVVKGIIPLKGEFPLRVEFPLPLEVVLDKQVATMKAASTAAQLSALLAVVRVEVADLESLKLVASTVVSLEQHTNESSDCQVPGLVFVLVVARAVVDHEAVPESQVSNLALVSLAVGR